MMLYILIGLSLSLTGVAGLQFFYMMYLERIDREQKKGKSKSEIVVYPNADHGFFADYRPSYNREAGEDAWKKLQEWFKRNGAA